MISSALEIKQALIGGATAAIADPTVMVRNGSPGQYQPDDIVSFGRYRLTEEPGPLSASRRARDVTVLVYATISVYRAGGEEQETIAEARCLELADTIGEWLRAGDNTKLGGRAFWCFRTDYDSDGLTDPEYLAEGRLIEATVEFTARTRITS